MYFKDEESVKGYFWKIKEYDEKLALTIFQKNNVSEIVSRLLAIRGINYDEVESYLEPKLKNLLKNPYHLLDMDKAVNTIYGAIIAKKNICVYGDYDVDGASATALLVKFFKAIGIKITSYVPDRIDEGYGLNDCSVKHLKEQGVDLIITVDCGISSCEPIDLANQLGIEVVVTDHHLGPVNMPHAKAIVNPNRFDETSEFKYLAGVGVAFMTLIALNSYLREHNYYSDNNIKEPNLLLYLDLVALGTVCDVMPLKSINRAFVKQGLQIFKQRKNIGLATLCDYSEINEINDTYHLGYVLGPRINACGRVGEVSVGNKILSCDDPFEARILANKLNKFNIDRQNIEKDLLDLAIQQVEKKNLLNEKLIFIEGNNWHEGVIGIIASRIKDKYNRPVIVCSISDTECKASCRSVDASIDIGSVILEAKEAGLLISGGGHAMAGGFNFKKENKEKIREFITEKVKDKLNVYLSKNEVDVDLVLDVNDINPKLIKDIDSIGPYGAGNHKPKIVIKNAIVVNIKAFGKNNEHLRLIVKSSNRKTGNNSLIVNVFRTNNPDKIFKVISEKHQFSMLGTLSLNRWMGLDNIQFILEDICL